MSSPLLDIAGHSTGEGGTAVAAEVVHRSLRVTANASGRIPRYGPAVTAHRGERGIAGRLAGSLPGRTRDRGAIARSLQADDRRAAAAVEAVAA